MRLPSLCTPRSMGWTIGRRRDALTPAVCGAAQGTLALIVTVVAYETWHSSYRSPHLWGMGGTDGQSLPGVAAVQLQIHAGNCVAPLLDADKMKRWGAVLRNACVDQVPAASARALRPPTLAAAGRGLSCQACGGPALAVGCGAGDEGGPAMCPVHMGCVESAAAAPAPARRAASSSTAASRLQATPTLQASRW